MASQFMGHIDALVRRTEIILIRSRGSVGQRYQIEKNHREGYAYLSFHSSKTGNIDITSGKVNSRFELSQDHLDHLDFAKKDDAVIIGKSMYFELWKRTDFEERMNLNPYTDADALSVSHLEQSGH